MSRPPPKIQNLEAEPRRHGGGAPGGGPPPAYHRPESETGSDYSSVSQMGKRRASWSNLVESDENLTAVRVNQYPNVKSGSSLIGSIATSTAPVSQIHSGHPLHPSSQPQSNPHHRPPSQLTHFSSHMFVVPKGTLVDAAAPASLDRSRSVHHAGSSAAPSVANSDAILADAKKKKRNRLQEILNWCSNPRQGLCALCLLLVLIVGIIAAIVIPLALRAPKKISLAFQAPEALRGGSSASTTIQMNSDGDQVRFMIRGSPPLKGNFLSVYDFKTNFIGVVDESLKNNGRQLFCFILRLDRGNIPDEVDLRKAAQETRTKSQQTQGWQETWSYQPQPLIMQNQSQYFSTPIDECNGARWMQLEMASTNQRTQQCTDCQGFCLPELGIEKDTVRDESYLNVVRLDCFQLFVPEWRQFAQSNSFEQNQRDFEQYYRVSNGGNGIGNGNGNGNGQAGKWINVNNGYAQNGGVMMPNGQLANGQLNPNNQQQQQQPGQTAQGNNLQNLQAAVFAGSLPQNNQQLQQQQQELQQYMKERNPGLINGQLGSTGLAMPTLPVVHPGAPPVVNNQQWHQGAPQQQWLNAQSASNPAVPPIGWNAQQNAMANGNGRNNNNNDGRWTGNEGSVGIGGTLNRVIQPALQGAQSGIQAAANTIQQGAQSVGEAVQSGLQQVQGGIQNLQGNVQDAGKSAQQIIQEARQRLQQQNANGVNPPSGYFQQMNQRQGGYPGYDNAYLNGNQMNQQQSGGTNLANPQAYNVQPF